MLSGPVIVLDGDDCVLLGPQIEAAIALGWTARGRPPPNGLLDLANAVNRAAEVSRSARFRAPAQVSGTARTTPFRNGAAMPACDEPVFLTVKEAARVAECSEGLMRRACRRGDLERLRGRQGAWLIEASSLGAWIGQRRRERERKAA